MSKKTKKNKYARQLDAILDLHGLIVAEAEVAVTEWLISVKAKKYKYVRIITGKGLNSSDGQAKLRPWLDGYLRERHYYYSMAKIDEGGEGAFDIRLDN